MFATLLGRDYNVRATQCCVRSKPSHVSCSVKNETQWLLSFLEYIALFSRVYFRIVTSAAFVSNNFSCSRNISQTSKDEHAQYQISRHTVCVVSSHAHTWRRLRSL
jgi:hypothetical protein